MRYRIVLEYEATDLPLVQLMATALKELSSQIIGSDLMEQELDDYEDAELTFVSVEILEMPPTQWQPREMRSFATLMKHRANYKDWEKMLSLPDFPVIP